MARTFFIRGTNTFYAYVQESETLDVEIELMGFSTTPNSEDDAIVTLEPGELADTGQNYPAIFATMIGLIATGFAILSGRYIKSAQL